MSDDPTTCWNCGCELGYPGEPPIQVTHRPQFDPFDLVVMRDCCSAGCARKAVVWTEDAREKDYVHDPQPGDLSSVG